jgi:hypothetical protein
MARNVTMDEWGCLAPGHYLIHDRDGKYCPAFQQLIDAATEHCRRPFYESYKNASGTSSSISAALRKWLLAMKGE